MIGENLKEIVNNSALAPIEKNIMNGFIDRAQQEELQKKEDRELIRLITNEKYISEVILSTDEVKIYTINGKTEWDIKYPYRIIYFNKVGGWQRCNTVSPNFDVAFLVYLENKYLGLNSNFLYFAKKMLEIPNDL